MTFRLQEWALAVYQAAFCGMLSIIESEVIPDCITRVGIRYLLSLRLRDVRLLLAVHCGTQFTGMPLNDIVAGLLACCDMIADMSFWCMGRACG